MLLENRVAIVTGAAGLIGRGIVAELLDEGARIIAIDRNGEGLDALAASLGTTGEGRLATITGDVTDEGEVARMTQEAAQPFGAFDILVNCAGRYANRAVADMTVREWDEAFAINTRSIMLMSRQAAGVWRQSGTAGAIVNISSGAGTSARAGSAHYASAKAAVNMLTEVMAIEFGPHGIRVNAISPGVVLEKVIERESDDNHPYINMSLQAIPLKRTGKPKDIAQAVAFLASDRAQWITGINLPVTGGSHCGRTHVPLTEEANFK